MGQENKPIAPISNPKPWVVDSVTGFIILIFSVLILTWLVMLSLGLYNGNPPNLRSDFNDFPLYSRYLSFLCLVVGFFLWKGKYVPHRQKKLFYIVISLFAIYCFSYFFYPGSYGGGQIFAVIEECYYNWYNTALNLFILWFIVQVASLFINNKIFWMILLLIILVTVTASILMGAVLNYLMPDKER